jgi:putative endonuclease
VRLDVHDDRRVRQGARRQQLTSRTALGRRAEDAVADYLRLGGFVVLGRNLRFGPLELDIVARKGTLLVVVEVRTRGRTSYEHAFESLGPTKRANLRRAVQRLWKERLPGMERVERLRVDVAAVTFEGEATTVEYVEGAL